MAEAITECDDLLTDEQAAIAVVALSEALSDVAAALAAIGILSNHLSTYFATVAQAAQPSKE
jgi:hypothetical protein